MIKTGDEAGERDSHEKWLSRRKAFPVSLFRIESLVPGPCPEKFNLCRINYLSMKISLHPGIGIPSPAIVDHCNFKFQCLSAVSYYRGSRKNILQLITQAPFHRGNFPSKKSHVEEEDVSSNIFFQRYRCED